VITSEAANYYHLNGRLVLDLSPFCSHLPAEANVPGRLSVVGRSAKVNAWKNSNLHDASSLPPECHENRWLSAEKPSAAHA
jgi:hypothetical protein